MLIEADPQTPVGRQQIRAIVAWVESMGDEVPRDLVDRAQSAARLADDGERRAEGLADRDTGDYGLQPLTLNVANFADWLGVKAGVLEEFDTASGRQFLRDLERAARAGDMRAKARLERELENQNLTAATKQELRRAIDRSLGGVEGPVQGAPDPRGGQGRGPDGGLRRAGDEQAAAFQAVDGRVTEPGADTAGGSIMDFWEGEGEEDLDPLIGVPADHRAFRDELGRTSIPDGVADQTRPGTPVGFREPRYRQSDTQEPFGWSEGRIAQLQDRLVAAGLLTGDFRRGWYDAETGQAYAEALAFANMRAGSVFETLNSLRQEREELQEQEMLDRRQQMQQELDAFAPDLPLPPDTSSMRQRARETLMSIGRRASDIDESEIAEMVNVLSGEFKQQRRVEEMRQRRLYEADVRTSFLEDGQSPITADLSDLEDVDPMARFDEWFQSPDGFGGEIQTRETSAEVARRGSTFEQGLNQMRGAVRRGGG